MLADEQFEPGGSSETSTRPGSASSGESTLVDGISDPQEKGPQQVKHIELSALPEAGSSSSKAQDTSIILVDKPGYRREIRTRTKTGKKYAIQTSGLWSTVYNLNPRSTKGSLRERARKRMKLFATFWPFVIKFATEVLKLGRWRFLFHLLGSTVTGLVPALRIYLSSRLIAIAQTASEKRILRKGELFAVATASYLSSYLETWVDKLLSKNNGILQRRFESMINLHLMSARARLDVQTLNKSRVQRDFSTASNLVHALNDGDFVVGQLIDLFTSAVSILTQASLLWSMTTRDNSDLALVSVFSASLVFVRSFIRRYHATFSGITNGDYNRMALMESMSHHDTSTFGERKVLGLGHWALREYKKASSALGDVSTAFTGTTVDPLNTAIEAIRSFSDTAIYVLFALKVAERPLSQATIPMSALTFIQNAARGLSGSLFCFVRDVQCFGTEFAKFKAYYRVREIQSAIAEPAEPLEYKPVVYIAEDGNERSGMEIEFKNVSFTWPGKKDKALDDISFRIRAGELCAIVGYNGAGKSTLISLISRLCDPDSGMILINGRDIRLYDTADLHRAMALLFQNSAELPLSLSEFIGIGDLDEVDNKEKIRAAATESGAIEFIEKLEHGFESTFDGSVNMETPDTLYKEAVDWDESYSDTDDGEDDKDNYESDSGSGDSDSSSSSGDGNVRNKKKSDWDDDKEDGRLAFSGGQRQKLVMARTFMRSSDLAIFDEYSSNLDPVAEHDLFKRITKDRNKQTIVYITHRYSTVRHADHILMLEKGKVTESGTHQELLAIPNGKYAEMCRLALGEGSTAAPARGDGDESEKTFVDEETQSTCATSTPLPLSRPDSPTLLKSS